MRPRMIFPAGVFVLTLFLGIFVQDVRTQAFQVSSEADLSIVRNPLSDQPDPVFVDSPLTYTLDVINRGPDSSTGVTLVDTLPKSVKLVSAIPSSGNCTESSKVVTCNLGDISNVHTVTVTIVVLPQTAGSIMNDVRVTGNEVDPVPGNNRFRQTTTVNVAVLHADLQITNVDVANATSTPSALNFRFEVTNNGPASSTAAILSNKLPADVTLVSATTPLGPCSQRGRIVMCPLGDLGVGDKSFSDITLQSLTGGALTNQARVQGNEVDPDAANDSFFGTISLISATPTPAPIQQIVDDDSGRSSRRSVEPSAIEVNRESVSFHSIFGQTTPRPQSLEVLNVGEAPLDWSVSSNVNWLSVSPEKGRSVSLADAVELSVDVSGLSIGIYPGAITVAGEDSSNSPLAIPVELVIESEIVSETAVVIKPGIPRSIISADGQILLELPADFVDENLAGQLSVRIQELSVETIPDPPEGMEFIRSINVNSLLEGESGSISLQELAGLTLMLTSDELANADGDISRLHILRWDLDSGRWASLPVTMFGSELSVMLDQFGSFAVGVAEPSPEPPVDVPQVQPTATNIPTQAPMATSTPVPELTSEPVVVPTQTAIATTVVTPIPSVPFPTPTPVVLALGNTPTPVPADTPLPTATLTAVPPTPEPQIPAAPAPVSTPDTSVDEPPQVQPETEGGLNVPLIVILSVITIAVIAGGYILAQAISGRRSTT